MAPLMLQDLGAAYVGSLGALVPPIVCTEFDFNAECDKRQFDKGTAPVLAR